MTDWTWLIGETVLEGLIPSEYACYRRPIAEGLRHFLGRLPAADIARILASQAALGVAASAEARLVDLAERCPVLHKLGQVLARDRRLAPELRRHLQRLESLPATTPLAGIEATLEVDLGPLHRLDVTLEPPALAEASVAVVIPFRHGSGHSASRGVFKVLKPAIEDRLGRELSALEDVGGFLDDSCGRLGIPALEYREVFEQVRELLGTEVDLRGEQDHLREAARAYAAMPDVVIPRVLPFCSRRVTAMERIDGHKVTEPGLHGPEDRRRLAEVITEALIAEPVFSPSSDAIFHADPHAGNLFVTPDRRLAVLDWSLAGRLGAFDREAITQLILGGVSLDAAQVRAALRGLSLDGRFDPPALEAVIEDGLREIRFGAFPGFSWLMRLVDAAVMRARLRARPGLLLFRKAVLTLEGVLRDVSSPVQLDRLLPALFLRRFVSELPGRLIAPFGSRDFGTRVSNEDLACLLLKLPSAPARAGLENLLEFLSLPCRRVTSVP